MLVRDVVVFFPNVVLKFQNIFKITRKKNLVSLQTQQRNVSFVKLKKMFFSFGNTMIKYSSYTTWATSLNIRLILCTYGLSRRVMSVQLDLTQSIRFLLHDRRSSHSTFFSRGRTLGPAAFNAPARATAHGPHKKGFILKNFFLIKNGHYTAFKPNTRSQIRVKKHPLTITQTQHFSIILR